tara:strand:+ start:14425 stop:14793 length:369 start_codon:yes stop_codon:yes gene_type:complete
VIFRIITIFFAVFFLVGCSNLDERHVFEYTIEGSAEYVEDMHTIMGPGLDWRANDTVRIPLEIKHEVYGSELEYKFEVEHSDINADVTIKVFIDEELIDEKSEFEPLDGTNKIIISGTFIAN